MLVLVLQLASQPSLLYETGAKFRDLSVAPGTNLAAQHRVIVSVRGGRWGRDGEIGDDFRIFGIRPSPSMSFKQVHGYQRG